MIPEFVAVRNTNKVIRNFRVIIVVALLQKNVNTMALYFFLEKIFILKVRGNDKMPGIYNNNSFLLIVFEIWIVISHQLTDTNCSFTVKYTRKEPYPKHNILDKLKSASSLSTEEWGLVNGRLVTEFSLITHLTLTSTVFPAVTAEYKFYQYCQSRYFFLQIVILKH